MTLTFPHFSLSSLIAQWRRTDFVRPASQILPVPQFLPGADQDHADRCFAIDMLLRNPDAIDSELGLMLLMSRWQMHG